MGKIKRIKPENWSTTQVKEIERQIKTIRSKDFIVLSNVSIGGDAPKDFIQVY